MANDNIEASSIECDGEEGKMLKLPIEMVKKILMYVDDLSRQNAALVCHTFYESICELDRDKNPVHLSFSEVDFVSTIDTPLIIQSN